MDYLNILSVTFDPLSGQNWSINLSLYFSIISGAINNKLVRDLQNWINSKQIKIFLHFFQQSQFRICF